MKHFFLSLLILTVTLTLAVPAFADLIYEPVDYFYVTHRDQCYYVNRIYTFAGTDGSVKIWSEPNGKSLKEHPNGEEQYISYCWSDGKIEWGYIDDGWVCMEDMNLVYDSIEFIKDHSAEIESVDPIEVEFHSATLFSYPNGPEAGFITDDENPPFSNLFQNIYTDEAGLRWGYVEYFYGYREKWICLDDPMKGEDPATEQSENTSVIQEEVSPTALTSDISYPTLLILAAVLVAFVVTLTGVLVHKIPKRK